MEITIFGVFSSTVDIEYALFDLKSTGYATKLISVILPNNSIMSFDDNYIHQLHLTLKSFGLSHDDARIFEKQILDGKIVVVIPPGHTNIEIIQAILDENGVDQVFAATTNRLYGNGKVYLS